MSKKVYDIPWIYGMSIWIIGAIAVAIHFIIEKDTSESLLYAFVVSFVLFLSLLFYPFCVEFDKTSITIYYLFGFFEKINWDSIWKIERQCFPYNRRYYKIYGKSYGKTAFFTSAKIPCTRKIRRLLREYWRDNF